MPDASHNLLFHHAQAEGRDYVTPEDVTAAMQLAPGDRVRHDLLRIIGLRLCGVEDISLCAFAACEDWQPNADAEKSRARLQSEAAQGKLV